MKENKKSEEVLNEEDQDFEKRWHEEFDKYAGKPMTLEQVLELNKKMREFK